jgi:hypothetical protein
MSQDFPSKLRVVDSSVDCNDKILVLYACNCVCILESTKVPSHYFFFFLFDHIEKLILKFNSNDLNNFKYREFDSKIRDK